MLRKISISSIVLSFFIIISAQTNLFAAPVSSLYYFEGTLTDPFRDLENGSLFSGYINYNYENVNLSEIVFSIEGFDITFQASKGYISYAIINDEIDIGYDSFFMNAFNVSYSGQVNQMSYYFYLMMEDISGTAFSTDSDFIPDGLTINDFTSSMLELTLVYPDNSDEIIKGSLTYFSNAPNSTATPEPASVLLLSAGMGALLLLKGRKKARAKS